MPFRITNTPNRLESIACLVERARTILTLVSVHAVIGRRVPEEDFGEALQY